MTRFSRLLAVLLAVLVAATSQQMALARGVATNAAGEVILCTGQGVVTVTVDAQGNPIGPVHICPDCALSFMDHLAVIAVAEPGVVHMQILGQTIVATLQTPFVHTAANARDPPLSV